MQKIINELLQKEKQYYDYLVQVKKAISKLPDTKDHRVRTDSSKPAKPQYYLITTPGDLKGRYVNKKMAAEMAEVASIIQRDYAEQVLDNVQASLKAIQFFLDHIPKISLTEIHSKYPARQALIQPYFESDEDFLSKWCSLSYEGLPFSESDKEIYTNKGERVRSKSEKIIADRLFEHGIPYRYEYPLKFKNSSVNIYPDFTLLDMQTRSEVILEHLGMMDDDDYCVKNLKKLSKYIKNNYIPGDNLLITYETNRSSIDVRILDQLLRGRGLLK